MGLEVFERKIRKDFWTMQGWANRGNGRNDITKNSRTFFNALTSQKKSQSEDCDGQSMYGGNRYQL
jgi:hypothetical protein